MCCLNSLLQHRHLKSILQHRSINNNNLKNNNIKYRKIIVFYSKSFWHFNLQHKLQTAVLESVVKIFKYGGKSVCYRVRVAGVRNHSIFDLLVTWITFNRIGAWIRCHIIGASKITFSYCIKWKQNMVIRLFLSL